MCSGADLGVDAVFAACRNRLTHWSSREVAAFLRRSEGIYVSHHYLAKLWRDNDLAPRRQGTFKALDPTLNRPDFVTYVDPPVGVDALSSHREGA